MVDQTDSPTAGFTLPYRRLLTDVSTGLVCMSLVYFGIQGPLGLESLKALVIGGNIGISFLLLLVSIPIGITISAISLFVLSVPLFVIEILLFLICRWARILSFIFVPTAERLYRFHDCLVSVDVTLKNYYAFTSYLDIVLATKHAGAWIYRGHLEAVIILMRNISALLLVCMFLPHSISWTVWLAMGSFLALVVAGILTIHTRAFILQFILTTTPGHQHFALVANEQRKLILRAISSFTVDVTSYQKQ